MKITRMLILLCFCVCLHMQAQTERFIENYKKEYHQLVNKIRIHRYYTCPK